MFFSRNTIRIHSIDTERLLGFLGHVCFYPLTDIGKQGYARVFTWTDEALNRIPEILQNGGLAPADGIRAYLFYGSQDNPEKGLFLASHHPITSHVFKPSSAFGNPVSVDEAFLKLKESNSRLHALIKLVLRDPRRPGAVNTFGKPMRWIGKSGSRGHSIAEYTPEFRQPRGYDGACQGFMLGIGMSIKVYIAVKDRAGISDEGLYLVGDPTSDRCFLLSPGKARKLFGLGYPVRFEGDGRKSPRSWLFGVYGKKAESLDSGEEYDRVTALSEFLSEAMERLREAGCSVEPSYARLSKISTPKILETAVKRDTKKKLRLRVLPIKTGARVLVPPFIPTLPNGILPVLDLRHDRTPGTDEIIDRLVQSAKEKGKVLNMFSDDCGNIGLDPALKVSTHDNHDAILAILHDKDFYAKNGLKDPYRTISRPMAVQHITVEELLEAEKTETEKEHKAGGKKTVAHFLTVILQELAIKQMLSNRSERPLPWRQFVVEPLWKHLDGVEVCAPGMAGKKYKRWCLSFPKEDVEVAYNESSLSCWHDRYLENDFLWPWEKGDPNHHYAFIRKQGTVVMFRIGGVEERIVYDATLLSMPHKDRFRVLGPLFSGVHRDDSGQGLLYTSGGVHGVNNISGAKRHMSTFYAWILEGTKEEAENLIEPLLYPCSSRLGTYPARPFLLRFVHILQDLYGKKAQ